MNPPPLILLVEDNDTNAYLATFLLSRHGFAVERVRDGRAGVTAAQRLRPAVVLMDLQMPLMDGLSAGSALLADPITRGIPILAVTACAMASDRDRALQMGFADFIEKPFNPLTFADRVATHVPEKRTVSSP